MLPLTRREFFMRFVNWLRMPPSWPTSISFECGRGQHSACSGRHCGCLCHG